MPMTPLDGGSGSSGGGHSHNNLSLLEGIKIDAYGRLYYDATGSSVPDITTGSSLCLLGNLIDISGQGNHPAPTSGNSPSLVLGLDNKPALYFNGSTNQELSIPVFLSGLGVTLYVVCCPENGSHGLIDTYPSASGLWRYGVDGNGYFSTFLNQRFEGYPAAMPASGYHLISIHARSSDYEVFVDKISKGYQNLSSGRFYLGNSFLISKNGLPFKGYLSLLCVVPQWLSANSEEHQRKLKGIKAWFPSVPFSL